jgi:putative hydrolase of the HAD superfamily
MPEQTWFLFDLGNTVIKLAYERVIERICADSAVDREGLVELWDVAGGYRDMERGSVTFWEFFEFLCDRAGYRGSIREFQDIWSDFFDGPVPGIEEVLERVRRRYRVAFLSNSNEVHADVIPQRFSALFQPGDRFIYSHLFKVAKPDPEIFHRALEVIGALPQHAVFVDDLIENVLAARHVGIKAFQFVGSEALLRELESENLLPANK